jgi:hypothetical protein
MQSKGLVFRHTDNISQWIAAMEHVKFPGVCGTRICRVYQRTLSVEGGGAGTTGTLSGQIFYPETTDLYERKNMPRVIYCIHALSRYLYHLGIAPEMEDLQGVAQFTGEVPQALGKRTETKAMQWCGRFLNQPVCCVYFSPLPEEELTAMELELQKAGVQMPKFGKIGGVLSKELGNDDAASQWPGPELSARCSLDADPGALQCTRPSSRSTKPWTRKPPQQISSSC